MVDVMNDAEISQINQKSIINPDISCYADDTISTKTKGVKESKMVKHIPIIDVMLTNACNMRCKYCFEKEKPKKYLDWAPLKKYLENFGCTGFFLFGGEPLLASNILKKLDEYINDPENNNDGLRNLWKISTKNIITNGTLVPKNIDFLKKYNHRIQISCDGPKEVHDLNRIDINGDGTFDSVKKSIELCHKEKLEWSLHGVCNKNTLKYVSKIVKFYFETITEYQGIKRAIDYIAGNSFQIIFEEDYSDQDIDILIEEFFKVAKYFETHSELTEIQKKQAMQNFFFKRGAICGAGSSLFALDTDLNIYPCHRLADALPDLKKQTVQGHVFDCENLQNYDLYNTFFNIGRGFKFTYSYQYFNKGYKNKQFYQYMWCPATNLQTSGNPYYVNSKYIVMMNELNRAINIIALKYDLKEKRKEK